MKTKQLKNRIFQFMFLLASMVSFAQTFTVDGFSFSVTGENPNTVRITDNTNSGVIVIPSSITFQNETYSVTELGSNSFGSNEITSVTIPNTVIRINTFAFFNNNISDLNLSEGISVIGSSAFRDNDLTNITLPSSITNLGTLSFAGNPLNTVTSNSINPPVLEPAFSAFQRPNTLDLIVPNGSEATYVANGWNFFSINGNLTSTGGDFTVDGINYRTTNFNPNTVEVRGGTIVQNLIIPASTIIKGITFQVNGIGQNAFRNTDFNSITLPNTIESIQRNAFRTGEIGEIISLNPNPPTLVRDNFDNKNNIQVTVPPGSEEGYINGGWNGFFSINNTPNIGVRFSVDGFNYRTIGNNPNRVEFTGGTVTNNLVIPESVTNLGTTFQVTRIAEQTLQNTDFNSITLPNTIESIQRNAFRAGEIGEIISLNPNPPILVRDNFRNKSTVKVTVPTGSEEGYINGGWNGFFSINNTPNIGITFTVDGFNYRTIGNNPNRVEFTGGTVTDNLVIPELVNNLGTTFQVSSIAEPTFQNTNFNRITLPNTIESLQRDVFGNSEIGEIISFNPNPPILVRENLRNRENTDLKVPIGSVDAYLNGGWSGFKSITEISLAVSLTPRVFLQGATINPNQGETTLMRDDLRVANLIPTTSPYSDSATVGEIMDGQQNLNPENDCVDWVFIELRDANDSTIVVASKSALLQRDGDIVNIDGTILSFAITPGDYFITINHRNHLGIITANPISLSSTTTLLDFVSTTDLVEGGENAMAVIGEGFTMISGDTNEDGQILNDDTNDILGSIGVPGYNNIDLDMDGQTLNRDLNIVRTNIGLGQRF